MMLLSITLSACQSNDAAIEDEINVVQTQDTPPINNVSDDFVLIEGGSFDMGSPEDEAWRSLDETYHTVTVSDFYISKYEVTQAEYEAILNNDPSYFKGSDLPVENVSWVDAVQFCNERSIKEGLTPAYTIEGETIRWDRSANGYRLPTEAEWEYACRAHTVTPFNTETSISAEEANYYGHYPYNIEENYFNQDNLETQSGQYRQTTLPVGSFQPNAFSLYDMHGNVSEWVWDLYGEYDTENSINPVGPLEGSLHIYRGGGWNDFAKNLRSAYRAAMPESLISNSVGIRLVRNAESKEDSIEINLLNSVSNRDHVLVAYFTWGGNTEGIAEEIASQIDADLFEITLTHPYSNDYNTVLDEAQRDQNEQARPELATQVEDMSQYDTVLLGYPNWWASIPMPIASFLEAYDFSNKTIIPFCSHGGGRFGQSITAISKLVPEAKLGEGLSIHYSDGSSLSEDVSNWLIMNELK